MTAAAFAPYYPKFFYNKVKPSLRSGGHGLRSRILHKYLSKEFYKKIFPHMITCQEVSS